MQRFLATLLLLVAFSSHASNQFSLPRTSSVPGGLVVVPVIHAPSHGPSPSITFQGNPVLTVSYAGLWTAIVGVPLNHPIGPTHIEARIGSQSPVTITFSIEPKEYLTQYLTVAPKHVDLSDRDLTRVRAEQVEIRKAFAIFSSIQPQTLSFQPPVKGVQSSSFGSRRIFNNQPRNPHSGMDIAAPVGTPVYAPASGRVVMTGDFFFNGKSVFLDHGQGLISMFCHLDTIDVTNGEHIQTGQFLGRVGATGRVTGPHLHWSVALNTALIDPALFLPDRDAR